MKKAYIITEGHTGLQVLKKVLPDNIADDDIVLIDSSNGSSALSLACSVIAVKLRPIGLIVNAETDDKQNIQERRANLEESLYLAAPGIQFHVALAVPEIEIIFFQDRAFIEKLANQKFSDVQWQEAKQHPKRFLSKAFNLKEDEVSERILKNLDDAAINAMRQHPLMNNLCNFLVSVINN